MTKIENPNIGLAAPPVTYAIEPAQMKSAACSTIGNLSHDVESDRRNLQTMPLYKINRSNNV